MLLEIDDIHVHYGKIAALKGISVSVDQGEIVTLIGANGAGKTTTLKTVSGLRELSSGAIRFDGADISRMAGHKRVLVGIGQAPEGRGIFPGMTVEENLLMGAYARKDDPSKELKEAYELFPRLAERRTQAGGTMSGGEQQMLAIGRALMAKPKVLLLDEPSMGLAPMLVQQIFSIIEEINRRGTTVLLVEQNAQQALQIAHRAYVLETGRVVKSAAAADLLDDPQVRAAYLGGDIGAVADAAAGAAEVVPEALGDSERAPGDGGDGGDGAAGGGGDGAGADAGGGGDAGGGDAGGATTT
ncbi:ABC transporter ATP-binding protein [Actinomadura cremea]|nr:ABC transporter ATP-binding protein [Actinomadura cremea]